MAQANKELLWPVAQDLVLDMEGTRSVHGGRTRFLKEGDTFGTIAFFTGAEQTEVGRRWLAAACLRREGSKGRLCELGEQGLC